MSGNIEQRNHFFGAPQLHRSIWHAKNDTAGLILDKCSCSRIFEVQEPLGPVLPHAGKHAGDGVLADKGHRRLEEDIHCRALVPDGRALLQADGVSSVSRAHEHMVISWRDEHEAGSDLVSVARLAHLQELLRLRVRCGGRCVIVRSS